MTLSYDINTRVSAVTTALERDALRLQASVNPADQQLGLVMQELVGPTVAFQRVAIEMIAVGIEPVVIHKALADAFGNIAEATAINTRNPNVFLIVLAELALALERLKGRLTDGSLIAPAGTDPMAELRASLKAGRS